MRSLSCLLLISALAAGQVQAAPAHAACFKSTWSAQMLMRSTEGPLYEYGCHEGNYSLPNALAAARCQERQAPEGPTK